MPVPHDTALKHCNTCTVSHHRIQLVNPVVQIAEEEQMMEVIRRVAEVQILRAERNALQNVADVVVSSDKREFIYCMAHSLYY